MVRPVSAVLAIILATGPARGEVYFRMTRPAPVMVPLQDAARDAPAASAGVVTYPPVTQVTEGNVASVTPSSAGQGATYEIGSVAPATDGITVPDAATGSVRVSDRVPAGTYTVRVARRSAGGVVQTSDAFSVQVLSVGKASEARPVALAYPNDARYYGLYPPEGQALSALYDRASPAVFSVTTDMPLDVLRYRFAGVTKANRCHIELSVPGVPDTVVSFLVNGGRPQPFTVPLVSGQGIYDGDCGLPPDYQTLQFTLTNLSRLEPGFFMQLDEFRLGYDGLDSP